MAGRTRRIVWAEGARRDLDQVLAYIAEDSPNEAARFLEVVLGTAQSLNSLGALWPNVGESFQSFNVLISAKFLSSANKSYTRAPSPRFRSLRSSMGPVTLVTGCVRSGLANNLMQRLAVAPLPAGLTA